MQVPFHEDEAVIVDYTQRAAYKSPEPARTAFLLGAKYSVLYVGFAVYIAERAIEHQIDELFFFTREGEFFIQVWNELFPNQSHMGRQLPPAKVLEVSRLATFAASLRALNTAEMMRLWNLYSTQSMAALLITLGLDSSRFADVCASHGILLEEQIVYPWQDGRVQALFNDTRFRDAVIQHIEQSRENATRFFTSRGVNPQGRLGIIDIGWRGTIQDNLAYLFPGAEVHGFYLGMQKLINEQPDNCRKYSFGPDENTTLEDGKYLRDVAKVEMLSNSPFGSVTGYDVSADGSVEPRRLKDAGEDTLHASFTQYFQNGVVEACGHWRRVLLEKGLDSQTLRPPALRVWTEIFNDKAVNDAMASLNHNETFGVGRFVNLGDAPGISSLLRAFFQRAARHDVASFLLRSGGPVRIWSHPSLNSLDKAAMLAAWYAARALGKIRGT